MNQYYLIPKELIDKRIEDYSILAHDKGHRGNYPEMNLCNEFINTLQSLTQQSELVEVEEYGTIMKDFKDINYKPKLTNDKIKILKLL